jgi:hypothetical protein
MDALNREFWVQFIASFVRKILFAAGALLEGYGVFTHDQVEGVTATAVVLFLTGLVIQAISLLWQRAKINFNILSLIEAVKTDPPADTPREVAAAVEEVKAQVADAPTTTASF